VVTHFEAVSREAVTPAGAEIDEASLARVADHLAAVGVAISGPLSAEFIAGGRSNWTYLLADTHGRWILRRPPSAGLTPSAHDVGREHRVTAALATVGVPVAPALTYCQTLDVLGVPFTVAGYVDGATYRSEDDLRVLDDEALLAATDGLIRTLAALHEIDHRAIGLDGFARVGDYAGRQLRRWSAQWDHVKLEDLPDAAALRSALGDRIPDSERTCVVHGDYRIDNVLLDRADPATVRAVIDWELSTLGDPVADVALMCCYRNPALDALLGIDAAWTSARLPSVAGLRDQYIARSGNELPHWDFHMGLACYKLAVIAQGVDYRFRMGATTGNGFESAVLAVPEFLAAGLRCLAHADC
jgi:aminoglycoside phosphotransferase (APT) family kinase protein